MVTLRDQIIEVVGGVTPAMLDERVSREVERSDQRIVEATLEANNRISAVVAKTDKRITEAASTAYREGFGDGGNDESVSTSAGLTSYGYKALGGRLAREYAEDPQKAMETIWKLYEQSGVASWIMDVMRNHFVSAEVAPRTEDEALQEILDAFWDDNNMTDRVMEFALQLPLLGSQCFPVFVRQTDGRARLGYIDPGDIENVVTEPGNAMSRAAVVLRKTTDGHARIYRIIREDDDVIFSTAEGEMVFPARFPGLLVTAANVTPQYEPWEVAMLRDAGLRDYTGSCIYRTWGSLSNQPRGWSALLPVADMIDQADETLYNMSVAERVKSYFLIDIKVIGKSDAELPAYAQKRGERPLRAGMRNYHNENEETTVLAPDVGQGSSIATHAEQIKTILGAMGLPFHWFGDGSDTNRATATEQSGPAYRGLKSKQMVIKKMLLRICYTVRDQAIIARAYPGNDPAEIDIIMPELSAKDTATAATTFNQVVAGVTTAEDEGYITHETAALLVAQAAAAFGVEYDVAEELEKAEAEQVERDEEKAAQRGAMLAQGLNVGGFGQNGGQGVGVEEE